MLAQPLSLPSSGSDLLKENAPTVNALSKLFLPHPTPQGVAEFRDLYRCQFGVELSPQQALELATRTLHLVWLGTHSPLPNLPLSNPPIPDPHNLACPSQAPPCEVQSPPKPPRTKPPN